MKRLLTIGLMLVSAFALTNCAEEIAAPVQDDITVDGNIENITPPEEEVDIPFEVFATVGGEAETKTQNIGNGTYWVANDGISVFHKTGNKITHNKQFTISSENLASGLFEGGLSSVLGETNDWFFLYPYKEFKAPTTTEAGDYSSSGSTLTVSGVQIGAQTINQALINTINKNITLAANSKAYICDKLSPMFGHLPNRPRNEQPEIEMKHLAAIVAIKVVNDGFGGDIKIKDVEFAVPDVYKTDNNGKVVTDGNGNPTKLQDAFPIVGQFDVNMANGQCTAIVGNSYASTKFELPTAVTLRKNESMTFYLPLMPFSATKTISIKVNGSERAISKAVKLESGKVTTFKVKIEGLKAEGVAVNNGTIISDAFTVPSVGRTTTKDQTHTTGNTYTSADGKTTIESTVISTTGTQRTIKVNGQDVEAYILDSTDDKITITGFFPDLINSLPIKFYVSTLDNNPAVMTVNKIVVHVPHYKTTTIANNTFLGTGSHTYTTDYTEIQKREGLKGALMEAVMSGPITLDRSTITSLGASVADKITFSNIATNGYFNNNNVVVLNEGFAQKEVNSGNIDLFLKNGFGQNTSFQGLYDIANAPLSSLPTTDQVKENKFASIITSTTVQSEWPSNSLSTNYPSIVSTVNTIYNLLKSKEIMGIQVAGMIIPSQVAMIHLLRDAKVSIELGTMEDGPSIVFWGLDATTPAERQDGVQ